MYQSVLRDVRNTIGHLAAFIQKIYGQCFVVLTLDANWPHAFKLYNDDNLNSVFCIISLPYLDPMAHYILIPNNQNITEYNVLTLSYSLFGLDTIIESIGCSALS